MPNSPVSTRTALRRLGVLLLKLALWVSAALLFWHLAPLWLKIGGGLLGSLLLYHLVIGEGEYLLFGTRGGQIPGSVTKPERNAWQERPERPERNRSPKQAGRTRDLDPLLDQARLAAPLDVVQQQQVVLMPGDVPDELEPENLRQHHDDLI